MNSCWEINDRGYLFVTSTHRTIPRKYKFAYGLFSLRKKPMVGYQK